MIGLSRAMYARYTLPLFPPLFLLVGALASIEKRRFLLWAALGVTGLASLFSAVTLDRDMAGPETRDRALVWIRAQHFKKIAFPTGPWHYHPPLISELTNPRPDKAREAAARSGFLLTADGEWNAAQLQSEKPDAVILSEAEYGRLHFPSAGGAYLTFLQENYPNRKEFEGAIRSSRSVSDLGLPTRRMPYDMGYANPGIVIFSRKNLINTGGERPN